MFVRSFVCVGFITVMIVLIFLILYSVTAFPVARDVGRIVEPQTDSIIQLLPYETLIPSYTIFSVLILFFSILYYQFSFYYGGPF